MTLEILNKQHWLNSSKQARDITSATTRRLRAAISYIKLARQVQSERRTLGLLDHDKLRDIGLDHRAAKAESMRTVFDLPDGRKSND